MRWLTIFLLTLMAGLPLRADEIYVRWYPQPLGPDAQTVFTSVTGWLSGAGHVVTTGTGETDYSGYDQVWDLQYSEPLSRGQFASLRNYMLGGGRVLLIGEGIFFDRNASIEALVRSLGGGSIATYNVVVGASSETFTRQGALLVNLPTPMPFLDFDLSGNYESAGSGFLVTRNGTVLGWTNSQLAQAPQARAIAIFDLDNFDNGASWTLNLAAFLGG